METTITEVMTAVRNFFPKQELSGAWRVEDEALTPADDLLEGDWIAIGGSQKNDGVWRLDTGLTLKGAEDERFTGRVWLLAPPPAFLALCDQIAAWRETHERGALRRVTLGAYTEEATTDAFGTPMGWQQVFAADLTPWRRMYTGVKLG